MFVFAITSIMNLNVGFHRLQIVKGLLKFWPKTCSQKEVCVVQLFKIFKGCDY